MHRRRTGLAGLFSAAIVLFVIFGVSALGQVNVYTRSYDTARSGANLQETTLTQANVSASTFGKLFTVHTDGQIYAQPLYVSNLTVNGSNHNVVFVATLRNSVYAIDADSGTVLWQNIFGTPIVANDVESDDNIVRVSGNNYNGIGILGTPVIDPATNYMYFVSGEQPANSLHFSWNLNAIDITTGQAVNGSPVTISASYAAPDLTTPLTFRADFENPRPGLALANNNVYIAWASHEDRNAYQGWVLAYSTSTLLQTGVYVDTTLGPTGAGSGQGGIWNAGQAPSVDSNGNLYIATGNGNFGTTPNGRVETGNSFIKLSSTLQLLDYFTPSNSATLNNNDGDLGSAGLLLLPGTSYVVGGGKQGVLYLTDSGNLGGFNASTDQVRQEFQAVYGNGTSHIHGGPVYYNSGINGPSVYVWGENDKLRGFTFNSTTGMFNTAPFDTSTMTAPATNNNSTMPGGFLSISANGQNNGIVWASTPYNADALVATVAGVLYAFDTETLSLLWTDKTNDARDDVGEFAKNVPPIVANGKMYIPNFGTASTTDFSGNLLCYGLLPPLTVNVTNASMTAGGAVPTLSGTVTGLQNGDTVGTTILVSYSTTANSNSPDGNYPITATVSGSAAANYIVTVNAGTLTVTGTPTLTVSANNATRVYNSANPAFTGTVTGAQNGDTFTETFATTATQASPAGSYSIVPTASGANLNNYTVNTVNGTLTITQATQTITFPAIAARSYGSAPFAVTATSSAGSNYPVTITVQSGPATISGGTVTLTGTGTVVLLASQAGDTSYAAATKTQSFAVTKAAQTITFPAIASRAYGSAPFAVSATSSAGTNYPVTITVQSGPATISGGAVTLTGAGTVVLLASQAGDTNYTAATATQSVSVTPAQLTATANNASRIYNTANPTLTGTVTGAVGSDTFTESFTTAATPTSNVGSYPIVPAVSGAHLANYTVNGVNGTLTVSAAATTTTLNAPGTANPGASVPLSATVASPAGTPGGVVTFYSGTTMLGTGTVNSSGLATLNTTALATGTDSLTATYATAGNFAGSTSAASSITVSVSAQTITFPAIATHVYGSAPFAVSATSSLGSSYPVTISVQSGPATISGGMVTVTAAGTLVLLATQAGDEQHGSATATQSFPVTPAALSVVAADASRTYGAANPTFTGTVTGAIGSDVFTETFSTMATPSSNVGSYPIVPTVIGPTANYTITVANGTLSVSGAATTTAVNGPTSATSGSSVTLTATVTSTVGTPAGSVIFSSGATSLGMGTLAGGVASLDTTALAAGTDTVTATYAAAGDFAGSSGTAIITVAAAPVTQGSYALSASPTSLTVQMGNAANTMLTFTPSGSYSGAIALTCTGLPANASCSFAQSTVMLAGNNQSATVALTIHTSATSSATQSPALVALAFWWPGGLTGLAVLVRKRRSKMPRYVQLSLLLLCTCAFAAGLSGCAMGGSVAAPTPTTTQVNVVATGPGASGVLTQSVVLSLTITQ